MNRYYINLDYTLTPLALDEKLYEGGSKSLFLTFCMHVTGVKRLFDEESVKEFLYRLAIVFRHYNIVSKFFSNDTLVTFDHRGIKIEFCLNDVIEHLGLETWDGPTDFVERKDWINKIEKYWENACKIALFTGIPILDRRVIGKNKFIIGSNKPSPITTECVKNAILFADEGMKTIGTNAFEELSDRVADKKAYLESYRKHLSIKPKHTYNYEKIPLKTKKRVFRRLYGPIFKYRQFFLDEVNEPKGQLATLMHLAWLWANGYITTYKICLGEDSCGYNAEVDERVDFSYENYDGLNHLGLGINLYDTFYDYGLDRVVSILKEE